MFLSDYDSDSDAKYSDSNPEDSDSHLAHYRPMTLSHITSCSEIVCVRNINSVDFQCVFLN